MTLYGIRLNGSDGIPQIPIARLFQSNSYAPHQTHNYEIWLHRIVVEVQENLQQASCRAKEGHATSLQVSLKDIEATPENSYVSRRAYPSRDTKTPEIGSKGAVLFPNAIEYLGASNDAADFPTKPNMAQRTPMLSEYLFGISLGQTRRVKIIEGLSKGTRFD